MGRKRRGKHAVSSSEADEPGNSSTSNPNVEWEKCNEQQLEIIMRKKLDDLYRDALSRLISMPLDGDVALKKLLERGYCVGINDCLTNVVLNSLEDVDSKPKEDEPPPQPFLNLELLVEFNLQFMVYILQKYRPNLNRISACRCILMNDLDLNRAILMDDNDTPSVMTEMLSNLNLDHGKGKLPDDGGGGGGGGGSTVDKDRFLALEIREMLNNLNVLDESISEDTKDMMIANSQKMIDDLEEQLKERIRWAIKKLPQARNNQTFPKVNFMEEIELFHEYTKSMIAKNISELSSIYKELINAEKAFEDLEKQKKEIQVDLSASKLIESEIEEKYLEFSKCEKKNKPLLKNREKQKVKMEEEMAMEKHKISKWEQELVEIEAAIILTQLKLGKLKKARQEGIDELWKEKVTSMERWTILEPMVEAVQGQGT